MYEIKDPSLYPEIKSVSEFDRIKLIKKTLQEFHHAVSKHIQKEGSIHLFDYQRLCEQYGIIDMDLKGECDDV